MPQDPRTYSPTTQEANRAREQGAGVGQRDLDAQQDANQVEGEARSFEAGPPNGDLFDDDDGLPPERPSKSAADREHGLKTRGRNKQIVSGKPYG